LLSRMSHQEVHLNGGLCQWVGGERGGKQIQCKVRIDGITKYDPITKTKRDPLRCGKKKGDFQEKTSVKINKKKPPFPMERGPFWVRKNLTHGGGYLHGRESLTKKNRNTSLWNCPVSACPRGEKASMIGEEEARCKKGRLTGGGSKNRAVVRLRKRKPCFRMVKKKGSVGGCRGGLSRKGSASQR